MSLVQWRRNSDDLEMQRRGNEAPPEEPHMKNLLLSKSGLENKCAVDGRRLRQKAEDTTARPGRVRWWFCYVEGVHLFH